MKFFHLLTSALLSLCGILAHSQILDTRFEIASDEIIEIEDRSASLAAIEPLPKDPQSIARRLKSRQAIGAPEGRLVFYERGKARNQATRRALMPTIAVRLQANLDPDELAKELGVEYRGSLARGSDVHLFESNDYSVILETLNEFSSVAGVTRVWPQLGRVHSKRLIPNDPYFEEQWHLSNSDAEGIDINVADAWDSATGSGVLIGIVDDGVQIDHPDLMPNANPDLQYDFRTGSSDPFLDLQTPDSDDGHPSTEDSHGTLVAGIAAAKGDNATGSTGVAPDASIANMRLVGGYTTDSMEAQSFLHEMDEIAIKNNSWGPPGFGDIYSGPDALATAALEEATTAGRQGRGTIFVFAAGNGGGKNDNSNKDGYSNSPFTLAVTAVDEFGKQSSFSEIGANIAISAPSGSRGKRSLVTTDLIGNDGLNNESLESELDDLDYSQRFSGTSASAPIVSGVIALMLESNPNLGWRDVQEILMRTARKIDEQDEGWFENAANAPFSFNLKYGAGLVDAKAAVDASPGWIPLDSRKEISVFPDHSLPRSIPDNHPTGTAISFSPGGSQLRVEHVQVRISANHANRGQLEIELESPSGTISQLLAESEFDQEADILDFAFSSLHFWGEPGDGTWTLRLKDKSPGDSGELRRATLILSGSEISGSNIPQKPSSLHLLRTTSADVTLNWNDLSDNESGFRIERSTGIDQPWTFLAEVPANATTFSDTALEFDTPYFYRVCALKGSLQSNYTPSIEAYRPWREQEEILFDDFERTQGYSPGISIDGLNGWIAAGPTNTRIVANQIPNQGNQLRLGGYGFDGTNEYNSAYRTAPFFPQSNSSATFSADFLIKSAGDAIDNFGFAFYGLFGEFLFAIDFDAFFETIDYYNDDFEYKSLDIPYALEANHRLEVDFDFLQNRWSASVDGQTVTSNGTIANDPAQGENLGLYYVEAFYAIHDTNSPGANYMLVDNLKLEQFATGPPDPPFSLVVHPVASNRLALLWDDAYLVDRYYVERRTSGGGDWTQVAEIPIEDWTYFHVDTGLQPLTEYEYRVRAENSFGFSDYSNSDSASTDSPFQDWLVFNDLDKDLQPQDPVSQTDYALLQAYALGATPERFSRAAAPQVDVDREQGIVTLAYYQSRDDVLYLVERRVPETGEWTSEGIDQEHERVQRLVTASYPLDEAVPALLRLRMTLIEQ